MKDIKNTSSPALNNASKKPFWFYSSWLESFSLLDSETSTEIALKDFREVQFFDTILNYAIFGKNPDPAKIDKVVSVWWLQAKRHINKALENWKKENPEKASIGFYIYPSWLENISHQTTTEKTTAPLKDLQKLTLIQALCNYSMNGELPQLEDDLLIAIWDTMKTDIDAQNERYNIAVENGSKGGRPGLTDIQKQDIFNKSLAGVPVDALSQEYQCSTRRIYQVIREVKKPRNNQEITGNNLDIDIEIDIEKEKDIESECVSEITTTTQQTDNFFPNSETERKPQSVEEVKAYFRNLGDIDYVEAYKYFDYNNKRGWTQKSWKETANRWMKRVIPNNDYFDREFPSTVDYNNGEWSRENWGDPLTDEEIKKRIKNEILEEQQIQETPYLSFGRGEPFYYKNPEYAHLQKEVEEELIQQEKTHIA